MWVSIPTPKGRPGAKNMTGIKIQAKKNEQKREGGNTKKKE